MSDEWVTIAPGKKNGAKNTATFYRNGVSRLPMIPEGVERGDWQFKPSDPSQVRFFFHDGGASPVAIYGGMGKSGRVSSLALQQSIGRELKGRYPCHIEGNAIIIDISGDPS